MNNLLDRVSPNGKTYRECLLSIDMQVKEFVREKTLEQIMGEGAKERAATFPENPFIKNPPSQEFKDELKIFDIRRMNAGKIMDGYPFSEWLDTAVPQQPRMVIDKKSKKKKKPEPDNIVSFETFVASKNIKKTTVEPLVAPEGFSAVFAEGSSVVHYYAKGKKVACGKVMRVALTEEERADSLYIGNICKKCKEKT